MYDLRKLIAKYLRKLADKFDAGTTEVTESQAVDILKVIAHEAVSKEQACSYLNVSRSRFDELVRQNKLPKGRKETGFKEKFWYKDELDLALRKAMKQ